MRLLAPAKLNLSLEIEAKRADGFHELRTLMVPIAFCDELEIERSGGELVFAAPGCNFPDEENLALRAARLFFARTGQRGGAVIRLEKHIPAGAGLGGGSSDAAAVLRALDRLYATCLGDEALMAMAAELGSDCAFFIKQQALVMGGRGEKLLAEVSLVERAYLLVLPPFGMPTAAVYRALKLPLTRKSVLATIPSDGMESVRPEDCLVNDLEMAAFELRPELGALKRELLDVGALGAQMSGSGSTVFGVFEDHDHLMSSMCRLRRREGYAYVPTTRLTGVSNEHYRSEGVSGNR
ncbi:MAG: 4-diphosphocytidyl-2-C-methyl-D-erythritol kinase [Deltaproteobacteria bacterium ADurb.Bin510]|nr:MAG: 4-diphosphocytidyl-2-C-methyl-D-erythritol kinase [Deltaproteobacteria bacterium ADurb.Bin510]